MSLLGLITVCFLLCPHRNYFFSAERQEEGPGRSQGEDDADQGVGDEDAESGEKKKIVATNFCFFIT